MEPRQQCGTRRRRQLVRGSDAQVGGLRVNGIDYVEVLDDTAPTEALRQRLLDVTFVRPDGAVAGGAPALGPEHFRVAGGSRVRGIVVESVETGPGDRTLRMRVDRAGDHSVYALSLHAGVGAAEPPANMDRALASVDVSFKVDCATGFDCQAPPPAAGVPEPEPAIDYLAKDYASFRQLMLDRMAETLPGWDERGPADLGVTLVEALAYAADQTSYHQDAIGTEAHLTLARLRTSVLRHARLLGYRAAEGANARTVVAIEAAVDRAGSDPALVPAGTRFLTRAPAATRPLPTALRPLPEVVDGAVGDGAVVFESMESVTDLRVARNQMRLHTWGDDDCRLPVGATVAHLRGTLAGLGLGSGDLVLLEELFPAGGGTVDPPDPAHRQVVRLAEPPAQLRDLVLEVDVVQVRWGEEDALRFALNLGSDAGEPGGVARGNLVLVDQGRTVDHGRPRPEDRDVAGGSGLVDDRAPGARPRPRLDADRVVHAVPFEPRSARALSAISTLEPLAEPVAQVSLTGDGEEWVARPDLLATDRFTPEFKVEPLDGGGARVLFPDAREGRAPDPDAVVTDFRARIRTGGGPAGNVGPDAIRHVVSADPGLYASVRNPVPGVGGRAAETAVSVKIGAPRAFRRQQRAVTPGDYATAAESFPTVQRAAAAWRWTGSWHTVFLAVDREGGRPVTSEFEEGLRRHLATQRLAGHDLEVVRPSFVSLSIELIVCVEPDQYAADVERDLLDAFTTGHRRDGRRGFFHPDHFSFGDPVRLSAIIAEAMGVRGVSLVGVRLGDEPPGRFERTDQPGVDHADEGEIPIGDTEVARLENDPDAPEHGRLVFRTRGGR